jgi:hypothetical protein
MFSNWPYRQRKTVFYGDDGGFRATHENDEPGDVIYYLGIIDCLTHVSILLRMTFTGGEGWANIFYLFW